MKTVEARGNLQGAADRARSARLQRARGNRSSTSFADRQGINVSSVDLESSRLIFCNVGMTNFYSA